VKKSLKFFIAFFYLIILTAGLAYGQSVDNAAKQWASQYGPNKWAMCRATYVEVRAVTAGNASDGLKTRLDNADIAMRAVRVQLLQSGVSQKTLDNLQQLEFDANKQKSAQQKGLALSECIDSFFEIFNKK